MQARKYLELMREAITDRQSDIDILESGADELEEILDNIDSASGLEEITEALEALDEWTYGAYELSEPDMSTLHLKHDPEGWKQTYEEKVIFQKEEKTE